ncbi:hypothetical protein [Dickeya ananatis]|uniref:hypothetical protein n=1 Tax=Dickeya ananatis TaxID=3061286 RepID=UPI00388D5ACD
MPLAAEALAAMIHQFFQTRFYNPLSARNHASTLPTALTKTILLRGGIALSILADYQPYNQRRYCLFLRQNIVNLYQNYHKADETLRAVRKCNDNKVE